MSIKKVMVLASMALALVALAAPAAASASTTITDAGAAVNDQSASFTGKASFSALGSGIECEVEAVITVNVDVIEATAFNVLNPHSCKFFGATYEGCKFESGGTPVTKNLPLVLDLVEGSETLTVTKNTAGVVGSIESEIEAQTGKSCPDTTNDITIVHEAAAATTIDIVTKEGFIDGATLTGKVKVDVGLAGKGTVVNNTNVATIAGTLNIDPTKTKTYTVS